MSRRLTFAAALAIALATVSEARAFEVKHTGGGELVRWRRGRVEWTVDRSVREVPGASGAVAAAVLAWTERGGAPTLVSGPPDASIEPGLDGKNTISYARDGFAPAGDALAVTIVSFDDRTGEVLDADIVMNGKYEFESFAPDAEVLPQRFATGVATYDVGRVVAHEMGHALGLSDERNRSEALMYPFVPRSRALGALPVTDDLAGLATLYGSSEAAGSSEGGEGAGCGGAIVARSGPRGVSGATYLAAGLALTALVVARGRGHRRRRRAAAGCTAMAAAALVLVPPSASPGASPGSGATKAPAFDTKAVVTSVHTVSLDGVFRSELELTTIRCAARSCPPVSRAVVWGGTLNGIRQVIGGDLAPMRGDQVSVVLEPSGAARVMTADTE